MGRTSGVEESEYPEGLWWGALSRSINSRKGQGALRKLRSALLALPERVLIADSLARDGQVCAIGALCAYEHGKRTGEGWPESIEAFDFGEDGEDIHETTAQAKSFGFSWTLAWTIAERNDDRAVAHINGIYTAMTDEMRYWDVLGYVEGLIIGLDQPTPIPAEVWARAQGRDAIAAELTPERVQP